MMTKDYLGCSRGTLGRDPSSADNENSEGCLPRSPDSTQVCQISGQEGAGRFFCVVGTRG